MTLRGLVSLLVCLLVAGAVALSLPRLEGDAPVVSGPSSVSIGRAGRTITIDISDAGSGLRLLDIRIQPAQKPGASKVLVAKQYPGSFLRGGSRTTTPERIELELDARRLALADGSAEIIVRVRDYAWRGALEGNQTELRIPVVVDTQPPRIRIASGLTYARRGGAGLAIYSVAGDATTDGVRIGNAFFRGYPLPRAARRPTGVAPGDTVRVALFALPVEGERGARVEVVASDAAGNQATATFPARISERRFPNDEIRLSTRFLERVPPPLARASGLHREDGDLIDTFQRVNGELRSRNESQIREIVAGSGPDLPWRGAFLQMRNTSVTSQFAELRSYTVAEAGGGRRHVSSARHYGFDLASTRNAEVPAANAGRVLFGGELGIYGRTVILDHGLGLTTLYAHLSRIDVEPGESVERGQRIGLSGSTGLAGGDHLHFAVLVGPVYVDPLEWFDRKWIDVKFEGPLGLDDAA